MLKNFSFILLLALSLLVSCGDLQEKGIEKKLENGNLSSCKMDTDKIASMMRVVVTGELSCLEQNLRLFIDLVESDRPGYLSQKDLYTFIRTNLKSIDEQTISTISAAFDLSNLLYGDKEGYLKRSNVAKLITLLKKINIIMAENSVYDYLTSSEVISYEEHNRRKFKLFQSAKEIGKIILADIVDNNNIIDLKKFFDHFSEIGNKQILTNAKSLLFIKKAILGGEPESMKAKEIHKLSSIFGDLIKIVYDFTNMTNLEAGTFEDAKVIDVLIEDLETAINNFYYKKNPAEEILTFDQLQHVVSEFLPEISLYFKYKPEMLKLKEILLGTASEVFTAGDLNILLKDILYENLRKGAFIYKTFETHRWSLSSLNRIDDDIRIRAVGQIERNYKTEFNRVIKNYRFYIGNEFIPFFGKEIKRNPRGVFEIVLTEFLIKKVFSIYGHTDENGEFFLSQEELGQLMLSFKNVLVGEKWLYPGRELNTAETITLMTTLFNNQSNGDGNMSVAEFTEFANTTRSSMKLASLMQDNISDLCPINSFGRYETQCFKDNFRSILDLKAKDKSLSSYLPSLTKYVDSLELSELSEFIDKTASFSRTCSVFKDGSDIAMGRGDGIVMWGGLLTIEQSMLRYDLNRDGILQPVELEDLYKIFKPAIEAMLPSSSLKGYAESFFWYIVKYKKVPEATRASGWRGILKQLKDLGHIGKYLLFDKSRLSADRMTFAAVLKIIAENSPAAASDTFDCDTLRAESI